MVVLRYAPHSPAGSIAASMFAWPEAHLGLRVDASSSATAFFLPDVPSRFFYFAGRRPPVRWRVFRAPVERLTATGTRDKTATLVVVLGNSE